MAVDRCQLTFIIDLLSNFSILFTTKKNNNVSMFLYQIVLLFRFVASFYHFVLLLMKNFHFKTKDLKSIVEDFKSIDIRLKNITTISLCSVDTSEKIFVENFEFDAKVIIDIEVNSFVKMNVIFENKTTIVDDFCFEIENESTIIINDLNFDKRFDFFLINDKESIDIVNNVVDDKKFIE